MLKTAEADDLLTMLWEEDLKFFKCQYVAQFTEGAVIPMAQAVEERADLGQVLKSEMEASREEAAREEPPRRAVPGRRWAPHEVGHHRPRSARIFRRCATRSSPRKGAAAASLGVRDGPRCKA